MLLLLSHRDTNLIFNGDTQMNWQTPSYNDIRFGFEVTMYINNK